MLPKIGDRVRIEAFGRFRGVKGEVVGIDEEMLTVKVNTIVSLKIDRKYVSLCAAGGTKGRARIVFFGGAGKYAPVTPEEFLDAPVVLKELPEELPEKPQGKGRFTVAFLKNLLRDESDDTEVVFSFNGRTFFPTLDIKKDAFMNWLCVSEDGIDFVECAEKQK